MAAYQQAVLFKAGLPVRVATIKKDRGEIQYHEVYYALDLPLTFCEADHQDEYIRILDLTDPNVELCICGDLRRDHPNDGPCKHNKGDSQFDLTHGGADCLKYRPIKTGT